MVPQRTLAIAAVLASATLLFAACSTDTGGSGTAPSGDAVVNAVGVEGVQGDVLDIS